MCTASAGTPSSCLCLQRSAPACGAALSHHCGHPLLSPLHPGHPTRFSAAASHPKAEELMERARYCQLVFELRPGARPEGLRLQLRAKPGDVSSSIWLGTGTAIPGVGEGDHHSSRAWYALSKQIYAFTLAIFSQLDDIPEPQIRPDLAKGRTLGPLFRQTCRIYCNNSEKGRRDWSHLSV
jgi:hypothetical protein